MSFERIDGDEDAVPGDVVASTSEVREALEGLYRDAGLRARLLRAAQVLLQRSAVRKRMTADDLFGEAVAALLEGRRKWPTKRVDLSGLLVGIMRSTVSNQALAMDTSTPRLVLEADMPPTISVASLIDNAVSDTASPDVNLQKAQERADEDAALMVLRAKFDPDELPGLIIDKIRERAYDSQAEIRSALGVPDAKYWNALKAVMRAADNLSWEKKDNQDD